MVDAVRVMESVASKTVVVVGRVIVRTSVVSMTVLVIVGTVMVVVPMDACREHVFQSRCSKQINAAHSRHWAYKHALRGSQNASG